MRRATLVLVVLGGLMLGSAFPVSGLGETEITLNCDDGTSLTATVDADGLTAATQAVQALLNYPAGLTCTLIQAPAIVQFGAVAYAWKKEPWINGGGHFQRPCPGGVDGVFWTNVAVNAQLKDGGVIGTFNMTVPGGQCVDPGHFTSKPTDSCLEIIGTGPGAIARITTRVTQTSGTYWPNTYGISEGSYVRSAFQDNGNPSNGMPDKLSWSAGFSPFVTCANGENPVIPIDDGNITIHPGQP